MYFDLDKRHIFRQAKKEAWGYGYNIHTLILKPEIKAWLDEQGIPDTSEICNGARGLINFEDMQDALMFKLRWL